MKSYKIEQLLAKYRERRRLYDDCQEIIHARFSVNYYEGYYNKGSFTKNKYLNSLLTKLNKAREHIATKIWRYQEINLAYQLCDAFAGVTLGTGIGMKEADCLDDYLKPDDPVYIEARASDERNDWMKLALKWLQEDREYYSEFSFMDAKGLYFHLPASLISGYNDQIEFCFFKRLQEAVENNETKTGNRYIAYAEMLTLPQKKIILKIIEREIDYDRSINVQREKRGELYHCQECGRELYHYLPMSKAEVVADVENSETYKLWLFLKNHFSTCANAKSR